MAKAASLIVIEMLLQVPLALHILVDDFLKHRLVLDCMALSYIDSIISTVSTLLSTAHKYS